jgi:hypothetical protein
VASAGSMNFFTTSLVVRLRRGIAERNLVSIDTFSVPIHMMFASN